MKILPLQPNTPEWLEARKNFDCSSDAAMVLGADENRMRSDGVRAFAIGDVKEFSEWEQKNLLDKGHEVEALARAIVEEEVGEMITPVVICNDAGAKLASLDGATIMFDTVMEHKARKATLIAYILEHNDLPPHNWPQCEHILHASDDEIKSIKFIVSDGTRENRTILEYVSHPKRRKALLAAWVQFRVDVKEYQHVEIAPKAIGTALRPLPQLAVVVMGAVERSNFPEFKAGALAMIKAIPTELKTDQDFADASSAVKWLDAGEKQCEAVKQMVLAGASSINEVMMGLDEIRETMRQKRLPLNSLIETRKSAIRAEIAQEGRESLRKYMKTLDATVDGWMPEIEESIGDRMSSKRTVATLRNAMETEVARVKALMTETAERIAASRTIIAAASEHAFLFNDARQLCQDNDTETVRVIVSARIIEHQRKEELRFEAERERIRLEEQAKAERESRERERRAQEQRDREAREQLERDRLRALEVERQSDEAGRKARAEQVDRDLLGNPVVERTTPTEPDTIDSTAETEPAALPVDTRTRDLLDEPRPAVRSSWQTLLRGKPDNESFEEWLIGHVAGVYEIPVQMAAAWIVTMEFTDIVERHALEGLL